MTPLVRTYERIRRLFPHMTEGEAAWMAVNIRKFELGIDPNGWLS